MPPANKNNERIAIMETVSKRLQETTDRLGEIADALRTDNAVHEERLKNQDKVMEELRDAFTKHQEDDRNAFESVNTKLDGIKSTLDGLVGADSVRAKRQ